MARPRSLTAEQIERAAEMWRALLSADKIADALVDEFGVVVTANVIRACAARDRNAFPARDEYDMKTIQRRAAQNLLTPNAGRIGSLLQRR